MILSRLLLVLLLATPILRANVLVVDARGAGDFTTLTAAVLAAQGGDTILVHDGAYLEPGQVVIDGKALTILGEAATSPQQGPSVSIRPGLVVRNLPPGKFVILENLELRGTFGTATTAPTPALDLHANDSHVRVQACRLVGGNGGSNANPHGAPAVSVVNSYSTALIGCDLFGGEGQFSPTINIVTGKGGPGLSLDGGQVHVSYSYVNGGDGGSDNIGGFGQGGEGGAGIRHTAGTLLVVGSHANGGDGGESFHGGDGGDGLVMGATGFGWLMAGSSAYHGQGGGSDSGPRGAAGANIVDAAQLVTDYGGTPHGFDVTSPLREGQQGTLDFGGDTSDSTLLFASLSLHQLAYPGRQGVLMLAPNALIGPFALGSGSGAIAFLAPTLPAAIEALDIHLQPIYVGLDGVVIGEGQVLTLLDASF